MYRDGYLLNYSDSVKSQRIDHTSTPLYKSRLEMCNHPEDEEVNQITKGFHVYTMRDRLHGDNHRSVRQKTEADLPTSNITSLPDDLPTMRITDLPDDLLITMLLQIMHAGFRFFCRAKATCKRFRDIANSTLFHRSVDFYSMRVPWPEHPPPLYFKQRCLAHNNPSALLLKGVNDYFFRADADEMEGLRMIQQSAGLGWDPAIYIYSMMVKTISKLQGTRQHDFQLTRESAKMIRDKILDPHTFILRHQPARMLEGIREGAGLDSVVKCGCAVHNRWMGWWDERSQIGILCDSCFWKREVLFFCNFIDHHFPLWYEGWIG